MKKSKLLFLLTALLLISINLTSAQSFKAGGGLGYGSDISSLGISVNGLYQIDKTWEAAASFVYFLESDNLSWYALNANAHYMLQKTDDLELYALAGLNITFWSLEVDFGPLGTISSDGSETNVNIGAGARKKLSEKIELFGEATYALGGGSYFFLNAGVLFAL